MNSGVVLRALTCGALLTLAAAPVGDRGRYLR